MIILVIAYTYSYTMTMIIITQLPQSVMWGLTQRFRLIQYHYQYQSLGNTGLTTGVVIISSIFSYHMYYIIVHNTQRINR